MDAAGPKELKVATRCAKKRSRKRGAGVNDVGRGQKGELEGCDPSLLLAFIMPENDEPVHFVC
jgi:hypothetical protein